MPKKGKKGPVQQSNDDDLAFLEAMAASNQAQIADAHPPIPEEVFKDLPPPPIDSFPNRDFPPRHIMEYTKPGTKAHTEQQANNLEELTAALPALREGGRVHQIVREWSMNSGIIKPGVKLYDMCSQIEEAVRRELRYNPPTRQLAFPCGCSLNNVAAHYSPVPGDDTILNSSDLMKIDFGVAVDGYIIDSAFSVSFDDRFKPLIDATIDATETGIKLLGPDASLHDIGCAIEEVITSYSLELDGKTINLKPVYNLSGHQMTNYKVHAGKFIPITKLNDNTDRIEPGELLALETFASTGNGFVKDLGLPSHFMIADKARPNVKAGSAQDLYTLIKDTFKTMAWSQRAILREGMYNYKTALDQLIHQKVVEPYPPLADVEGCFISQHEHTIAILEDHKEVVSRQ